MKFELNEPAAWAIASVAVAAVLIAIAFNS